MASTIARLDVKWGALLLAICMIVPILFLGGVTHGGLLTATVVLFVLLPFAYVSRRTRLRWPEARVAIGAFAAAAGWEIMQLLPLPPRLLRALSPRAAALWAGSDAILATPGRWHPVSVDIPETAFMIVGAIAVGAFFIVCLRHASAPTGARTLAVSVVIVVLGFDLVALVHSLIGAKEVYGVFLAANPGEVGSVPIVTSLLNSNHAAALACVGPPLLIGFAIETHATATKILAVAGAIVSSAVSVMTFSRGGFAVLGLMGLTMAVYRSLRPGDLRARAIGALAGFATMAVAAAAALYIALQPILDEAAKTDTSKFHLFTRAATMIPDFFVTGVGRGAFSSAFAGYEGPIADGSRFTHVECWPVQLAIDFGTPFAIAFIVALGWVLIRCVRSTFGRPTTFGALVALCGLGIHDLADFSMEFVGVGLIASALLAIVVSTRSPRSGNGQPGQPRWPSLAVGAAPLLAFVAILRPHWQHGVVEDCSRIAEEWKAGRLDEAGSLIAAAEARHPAEPYFPMVGGVRILATPEAAPLLVRSVELGPRRGQGHYWLGRWFLLFGHRGQAWAEYREALRLAPAFRGLILDEMLAVGAPLEDIESTATKEDDLDSASARLESKGRTEDAERLDEDLIHLFPPAIRARLRIIDRFVARHDLAGARPAALELIQLASTDPRGYIELAKATDTGEGREAALEQGLGVCGDQPELLDALVRARGARLGLNAVRGELERLRLAYAQLGRPERFFAAQAEVELASGHPAAAIGFWLEAASAAADGDAYLRTAASVAEQYGQAEMAQSLYRRLAQVHPDDEGLRAALARLKATATAKDSVIAP